MAVRNAPTWIVNLNGQPAPQLQPLRVQRSLNGERMDYAELMLDTNYVPNFNGLDGFSPFNYLGNYVDIKTAQGVYVHQGIVVTVAPRFNSSQAGLLIASRTDPAMFGLSLFGQRHWNPLVGEFFITDDELVFNPLIDGRTFGNKHDSIVYGQEQVPVFLSPEATRTAAARNFQGGNAVSWVLSEVIYYLCWMANRTQTFLVNPTLEELQMAVIDSVDFVRNLKIAAGATLPEALDATLIPLGYHWRIVQAGMFALNKLQIIRRASGGTLRFLKHQRMGERLNTALTDTEAMGVRFETDRLANQIVAKGAKIQVEITAELHRGWPVSLDSTPLESLKLEAVKASEDPDMRAAWRKWVLNEAGDYLNTRPTITGLFTDTVRQALSSAGLLEWFLPRRRKFLPTITRNAAGTAPVGDVRGLEIEYKDYAGNWVSAKNWGFDILDTECGVYLRADDIPEELYDQGDYGVIRVTATIEADYRITHTSWLQPDSVLPVAKEHYLELPDSYQHRVILTGSKYAATSNNLAVDDSLALQQFADSLRARFDQLSVPGGVTLDGVDHLEYQPGDRIGGVQGKNISFEVKPGSGQYPQVVSVTLDIAEQKTMLQLQRFREFRPQ